MPAELSADFPVGGRSSSDDPFRILGIVGLVLSVVLSVVGLIVSIIALIRSRRAGYRNGFASAGVVVGVITTIITVLVGAVFIAVLNSNVQITQQCKGRPNQPVQINGQTVMCPANS